MRDYARAEVLYAIGVSVLVLVQSVALVALVALVACFTVLASALVKTTLGHGSEVDPFRRTPRGQLPVRGELSMVVIVFSTSSLIAGHMQS
jgi:hypothetical protein